MTGHILQPAKSRVFEQMSKISEYASNYKKTKMMLFNPSTSKDFMQSFTLDGHEIETVEKLDLF